MDTKEIENFIDEWCNLYPENIQFNGNKLKSKPKDCISKMLKFCKSNPIITKDIIFAATNMYLDEQEKRNWEYTRQATYFISKIGHPSLLEVFCDKILAKTTEVIHENYLIDNRSDFI